MFEVSIFSCLTGLQALANVSFGISYHTFWGAHFKQELTDQTANCIGFVLNFIFWQWSNTWKKVCNRNLVSRSRLVLSMSTRRPASRCSIACFMQFCHVFSVSWFTTTKLCCLASSAAIVLLPDAGGPTIIISSFSLVGCGIFASAKAREG